MTSALDALCGPGRPLRSEPFDEAEFEGLRRSGVDRLDDAEKVANSLAGRFDLAYNAAHALSLAALRRLGYRAANRYIVFQTLPIRSVLALLSGGSWRSATTCAIKGSTKACLTWMNGSSPTWWWHAGRLRQP